MSSEELERHLSEAILEMVKAGVRPEDMTIEFAGMKWKWCPVIRKWGQA